MLTDSDLFKIHMEFDEGEKYNWIIKVDRYLFYFENRVRADALMKVSNFLMIMNLTLIDVNIVFENSVTKDLFLELKDRFPQIGDCSVFIIEGEKDASS